VSVIDRSPRMQLTLTLAPVLYRAMTPQGVKS
jgi:hypothetical protein